MVRAQSIHARKSTKGTIDVVQAPYCVQMLYQHATAKATDRMPSAPLPCRGWCGMAGAQLSFVLVH